MVVLSFVSALSSSFQILCFEMDSMPTTFGTKELPKISSPSILKGIPLGLYIPSVSRSTHAVALAIPKRDSLFSQVDNTTLPQLVLQF